jgi:hypothetical protein
VSPDDAEPLVYQAATARFEDAFQVARVKLTEIEQEDHRSSAADHAEHPAVQLVRLRQIGLRELVDGSQDFPLRGAAVRTRASFVF